MLALFDLHAPWPEISSVAAYSRQRLSVKAKDQ
jgi:hypothetical protein